MIDETSNLDKNANSDKVAEVEAGKMMCIKQKDLPKEAREYLKYLSSRWGYCGETCITAFARYNQAVLKMRCKDDVYKIDADGKRWFINYENSI